MDFLLRKSGGLFARDYKLSHNGSECCILSFHDWKYAEFLIDENSFVIRSDGKARWVLEQGGTNIASCKRHASGSRLEFSIDFDDRTWCFKPNRKKLVFGLDIWEGELKIGRIAQHVRFWSSEVSATFIQAPGLEIAGFAVWLTGIHWVGVAGKLIAVRAETGI